MSTGREKGMTMDNHLGKNPHSMNFQEYRSFMDKLESQMEREAIARKAKKEKKNG